MLNYLNDDGAKVKFIIKIQGSAEASRIFFFFLLETIIFGRKVLWKFEMFGKSGKLE